MIAISLFTSIAVGCSKIASSIPASSTSAPSQTATVEPDRTPPKVSQVAQAILQLPQIPELEKGMSYDEARQMIINAGWQPILTTTDNPLDGTANWRKRGYNEVTACSGTGMGFCRFEFAAGNRKLAIVTAGRDSTLHHWSEESTSATSTQTIVSTNPQRATPNTPPERKLPDYCEPDNYTDFFTAFVAEKDRQGNETRNTYTADQIEVRSYNNPDQIVGTLRRQDDEFSIASQDYRWVQLVPSSVDNSPYTRLKLDIQRVSQDTFRVNYIKAQYKYTGDVTGTESEELVQTYGNPAAYIFQHRNGCWMLTQKLQSNP
jgi:hypothetical protein